MEAGALRECLTCSCGFDAPTAEVDRLFREIDADGSGVIEFRELHKVLRQGASIQLDDVMRAGAAGEIELARRGANQKR